jgi:Ni,Fe-hydrogenase I cytochrome b subunit
LEQVNTLLPVASQHNGVLPNLESIVRYLKLTPEDYLAKTNAIHKIRGLLHNLSFKSWHEVSVAQGWLITSFTPVSVYMSLDNCMAIFGETGNLVNKISLKEAKVNRVDQKNVVYL